MKLTTSTKIIGSLLFVVAIGAAITNSDNQSYHSRMEASEACQVWRTKGGKDHIGYKGREVWIRSCLEEKVTKQFLGRVDGEVVEYFRYG